MALGMLQTLPHVPQLVVVEALVSQPLVGLLSQSANPGLHIPTAQALFTQLAAPFWTVQTLPHVPQDDVVFVRSTSQPLAAL